MLDIKITKTTTPKAKPTDESKLGFGKVFTDHMFIMNYDEGQGWHDARIVPYAPIALDPSAVVFHYAQECFEGMKAYRTAEGKIQLFRPDCNARRMNNTQDRLCIPEIPVEDFVQAVKAIVEVEKDWVPHSEGASLYIRPFTIATMASWASTPPPATSSSSSALPPAPTTPRVLPPSRSTWRTPMSAPARAAPASPSAAATMP